MFDLVSKLDSQSSLETFFWFCALAGTGLFIVQSILLFMGLGEDEHCEEFKWFSKQAVIGFLMMFGWVALTCRLQFEMGRWPAAAWGCGGGVLAMLCTGLLFKWTKQLRSPGQVFKIEETIGKQATVYQRIPKEGKGKISIALNHLTHELDAISLEGELPSFTQVKVINKVDETTVVVAPIQ